VSPAYTVRMAAVGNRPDVTAFAPKAPEGKSSNWLPTDPKGRFEALFRFCGPENPLFDKTWVLPDIEKIG